jgi:hypothetical protein
LSSSHSIPPPSITSAIAVAITFSTYANTMRIELRYVSWHRQESEASCRGP